MFPTNDSRSRPGSKIQTSGKHKSSISDSMKPSKSKFKRNSVDTSEIFRQQVGPLFQSMPSLPAKDLRIDLNSLATEETVAYDMDCSLPFDLNEEKNSLETENLDMVSHEFVSGLMSGLDDYSEFSESTDIG